MSSPPASSDIFFQIPLSSFTAFAETNKWNFPAHLLALLSIEIYFSAKTGRGAAFRVAAWPSHRLRRVDRYGAGGPGRSSLLSFRRLRPLPCCQRSERIINFVQLDGLWNVADEDILRPPDSLICTTQKCTQFRFCCECVFAAVSFPTATRLAPSDSNAVLWFVFSHRFFVSPDPRTLPAQRSEAMLPPLSVMPLDLREICFLWP